MDFFKKWLRKHEKFLLHFLIHIDVYYYYYYSLLLHVDGCHIQTGPDSKVH